MLRCIRVFGPDGAGKSSIIRQMELCGFGGTVINGSAPESWPDPSWHQRVQETGLDRRSPDYHMQTAAQCYRLVGGLLGEACVTAVLDSDPQHTIAAKAHVLRRYALADMYATIGRFVSRYVGSGVEHLGVHVTVPGENEAERGRVLFDRMCARGESSMFDPQAAEVAADLAATYDRLEAMWARDLGPCIRLETNPQVFDAQMLAQTVLETL